MTIALKHSELVIIAHDLRRAISMVYDAAEGRGLTLTEQVRVDRLVERHGWIAGLRDEAALLGYIVAPSDIPRGM